MNSKQFSIISIKISLKFHSTNTEITASINNILDAAIELM